MPEKLEKSKEFFFYLELELKQRKNIYIYILQKYQKKIGNSANFTKMFPVRTRNKNQSKNENSQNMGFYRAW